MIVFTTLFVVVAAFALYGYGMNKEMEKDTTELNEELWPYI